MPHISQQVQQRPGITDVQKDNLQRTLRMISEIAPGKRPDEMLLRFVMSKAEPMEAHSNRMIVEAWNQQHEQQLLQQHRQQLLLQQHQKQQQQPQHQEQGQRQGSTATENTVASNAQQAHALADSDEVKQQPLDTQEYLDSSSMDSDFEQSSKDQSEDQLGTHTSSAEHSHDQAAGQQKKTPSYQADGQQRASPRPAEGQQRAFPRQTEGQQGHSRQSALQQGASTHLQRERPGGHAQQQQPRQGQLQGQGLWPPSSLAQDPDANPNPLLQEGMPHWQRQMLQQAHAQQLALSQQSDGARSLAHMLQRVSANPVEPQSHAQTGESQEESVPAAQAKQREAEQRPSPQAGTMTGMRKGSSAESPRAVMQTHSPSMQRSGSLQRDESAGRVLLDAGMPPEPISAEQGYQSQRLQTHQPHRLQGQWQQPKFSQGQLHESQRDQQSRPPSSQGAQQGYFQSQQPQPQQPQEGLPSQQPISVNQAPQLSHLSRFASMSDDLPGQQDDAVRSELHAIQQQLLAQSRSRSTDADKQVCAC